MGKLPRKPLGSWSQTKRNRWFDLTLANRHGDKVVRTSDYLNTCTDVGFQCQTCGYSWNEKSLRVMRQGTTEPCPICANAMRLDASDTERNLWYDTRLNTAFGDLVIRISGSLYRSPIKLQCTKCRYTWEPTSPRSVLGSKHGCPACATNSANDLNRKTFEDRQEEIRIRFNGKIKIKQLAGYSSADHSAIKAKCFNCGLVQTTTVTRLLRSQHGCPDCAAASQNEKVTLQFTEIKARIKRYYPNIKPLTPIGDWTTPVDWICKEQHKFTRSPKEVFLTKLGCHHCGFLTRNDFQTYVDTISGVKFRGLRGFDSSGIEYLVDKLGYSPETIRAGTDLGLVIPYPDPVSSKPRRYYPDAYVPDHELVLEVKGPWTLLMNDKTFQVIKAKHQAVVTSGLKFLLLVFATGGTPLKVPRKWWLKSYEEMCAWFETTPRYA